MSSLPLPPRHATVLSVGGGGHTLPGQPTERTLVVHQTQPSAGLRLPSNRKTIYDRHLNRSRNAELSRASFAYLFGEMVTYAQRRVTGIQDLERRYSPFPFFTSLSAG